MEKSVKIAKIQDMTPNKKSNETKDSLNQQEKENKAASNNIDTNTSDNNIYKSKDMERKERQNNNIVQNIENNDKKIIQKKSKTAIALNKNHTKIMDQNIVTIQTITTKIDSFSYPSIVVQKGIPVKWIIIADQDSLNECNNTIIIPKLKIEKNWLWEKISLNLLLQK
jgi:hypothetical protein